MYCVVQEIELKKPNKHGEYKELISDSFTFTIDGVTSTKYSYKYRFERFERPIKKAYKVSIHESKRVNGVVTKRQYAVTTVEYYSLAEFWIGDCLHEKKLQAIADKLGTSLDHLWDLINAKVDPLQEQIRTEYQKTDEYKTWVKHRKIIDRYNKARTKFAKTYDCDADKYDYCYNVFGELMNQAYFDKVINEYKQRRSYQNQSHSNYSGYGNFNWNGFGGNSSSYFDLSGSNYNENEKTILKKFYRTLSKEYHPDNTRGSDEEMQLVNQLKVTWGI